MDDLICLMQSAKEAQQELDALRHKFTVLDDPEYGNPKLVDQLLTNFYIAKPLEKIKDIKARDKWVKRGD